MEPLVFTGKYTDCKVFAPEVEASAIQRIFSFLNCPVFAGVQIRIMPDVHEGKGAVIGFTAHVGDKVIPNVIGVDIGCGVQGVKSSEKADKVFFTEFDKWLRAEVPAGKNHRVKPYKDLERVYLEMIGNQSQWSDFEKGIERVGRLVAQSPFQIWCQVGTLGGGNHFIELDEDLQGDTWLTVHSGSRNFGKRVAEWYQTQACIERGFSKTNELAWLEGQSAQDYLRDMRVAQTMALLNRLVMIDALVQFTGGANRVWDRKDSLITSVHNFIGDDDIVRKGAISAHEGEKIILPLHCAAGLLIGVGKGNADWNNSAPHGAGRKMSRGDARRGISMHAYEKVMTEAGVFSTCVGENTLDEAPQAYKDPAVIEECIADTMGITDRLRPVYSFKASEDPDKKRAKQERKFKRERADADAVANLTLDGVPDVDEDV